MEEATSPTAPPNGTSSKLVHRISNDDDPKHGAETPANRSRRSFLNCFGLFSSTKPERSKVSARPVQPKRKNLRTSTISTISLARMDSSIDASPYKWPHDNSFDPKTTALVIIDMQKDCEYSLMCSHLSESFLILVYARFTLKFSPHFHSPYSPSPISNHSIRLEQAN